MSYVYARVRHNRRNDNNWLNVRCTHSDAISWLLDELKTFANENQGEYTCRLESTNEFPSGELFEFTLDKFGSAEKVYDYSMWTIKLLCEYGFEPFTDVVVYDDYNVKSGTCVSLRMKL